MPDPPRVSVIIPAHNEATRIAETVRATKAIEQVSEVVVVDDGSTDQTAAFAERAGAQRVVRLTRNRGKGAALQRGLSEITGNVVLLLDADLGASAREGEKLLAPVLSGEADLTIATFAPQASSRGFGLVVKLARYGIWLLTGARIQSPLSGQRAARREVFERIGFADGFAVETAGTAAALLTGSRVLEVPTAMTHAVTGRDWSGWKHRARQFLAALRALVSCALGKPAERDAFGLLALGLLLSVVLLPISLLLLGRSLACYALACAIVAAVLFLPVLWFNLRAHLVRANYAGKRLPASFGILWVLTAMVGWLLASRFTTETPLSRDLAAALVIGLGMLGVVDDAYGSRSARGFRGHLRALRHGRITTGLLKALLGGWFALAVGLLTAKGNLWTGVLNGLMIALCTNFMNLFDLRPGRALKVFFLAVVAAIWLSPAHAWLLAPVLAAALLYAPVDFAAGAMMGDSGANPLGSVIGLVFALSLGWLAKLIAVLILIAVHIYAERYSLGELIERLPVLRTLDAWGREQARPVP